MLEDYELLFRGGNGSAVATVESREGCIVPCALWLITEKDEAALDCYEGYSHLYRKEMLPVQLGRRKLSVMAYVMNAGHKVAVPSMRYLRIILDGYKDFGLDTAALDNALRKSLNSPAPYRLSD